jgi:DNA-binding NarL/FixJ family response regulator
MSSARKANPPSLALIEHQQLVRSTVAGVVRQLVLARVIEFSRVDNAVRHLEAAPVEGLFITLDDEGEAMRMLARLREGGFRCATDIPVAVMAAGLDAASAASLRELGVRRVLLKPFKVKAAIETISSLWTPVPAVVPSLRPSELAEPIDLG